MPGWRLHLAGAAAISSESSRDRFAVIADSCPLLLCSRDASLAPDERRWVSGPNYRPRPVAEVDQKLTMPKTDRPEVGSREEDHRFGGTSMELAGLEPATSWVRCGRSPC